MWPCGTVENVAKLYSRECDQVVCWKMWPSGRCGQVVWWKMWSSNMVENVTKWYGDGKQGGKSGRVIDGEKQVLF